LFFPMSKVVSWLLLRLSVVSELSSPMSKVVSLLFYKLRLMRLVRVEMSIFVR
jgi:hypothetical protein